jgi:hypothetical protein
VTDRRVSLVSERDGPDSRFVDAYLDERGNLKIDGQDLGPATAPVSSDGEYEWIETVPSEHLARAVVVLGGADGEQILDVLARDYRGAAAYGIRQKLDDAGIPVDLFTWSG